MNLIIAAATLPPREARAFVRVMCRSASSHERTMKKMESQFKDSLMRVLDFAKHETLRKLHRYTYRNRALTGQDAPQDHGAFQVGFDLGALKQDLEAMFYTELPNMFAQATDSTLKSVGSELDYVLPQQDAFNFIARRQNLLSGVPDEIYQEIRNEIAHGLKNGESIAQLSERIRNAFDQINQGRAETIAQNETAAAYSFASQKAALAAGVKYKKWLHGVSKVPRADHLGIDGLVVPIEQAYPVGAPPLMYPHDENGSPEDVINCSCISVPASASEYNGSTN